MSNTDFLNRLEVRETVETLLQLYTKHLEENVEDREVAAQKTRWEKFWCWLIFGHLPGRENVCKRCGKIIKQR